MSPGVTTARWVHAQQPSAELRQHLVGHPRAAILDADDRVRTRATHENKDLAARRVPHGVGQEVRQDLIDTDRIEECVHVFGLAPHLGAGVREPNAIDRGARQRTEIARLEHQHARRIFESREIANVGDQPLQSRALAFEEIEQSLRIATALSQRGQDPEQRGGRRRELVGEIREQPTTLRIGAADLRQRAFEGVGHRAEAGAEPDEVSSRGHRGSSAVKSPRASR